MTAEKLLGKIEQVNFGKFDDRIGIFFTLSVGGYGVNDFWGDWSIERSDYCKWTDEDRIKNLGKMVMRVNALLSDAKVESVHDLKDLPIEATIDRMQLVSWRVLKEVL